MAPGWPSKVEVTPDMTMEHLRRACVDEQRETASLLLRERHAILKALYRAIKGKGKAYEFQGGLATQMDDNEAEWLAFLRKHGDLQHLDEIDIGFPEPTVAPAPAVTAAPAQNPVSSAAPSAPSAKAASAMEVDQPSQVGSNSKAAPSSTPDIVMTPAAPTMAGPVASTSTATAATATATPVSAGPSAASLAPPAPAQSTSVATSGPAPAATPASPSSGSLSPAKSIDSLAIPVAALSPSYVSNLPDLPFESYKTKFAHATRRKGKEKATTSSGGPDLYKMQIKAQHTGIKNFIGRGKRVHNVLSSHDWMVGLEEIRSLRAFEKIDQLKNDKAWSFRQPKKQRAGFVTKAHWDHLLDEMRWLQTDFRQETRWKIAVACSLAKEVRRWHKASPEARAAMCVKTRPPQLLEEDAEVPTLESMKESPVAVDRRESMDVDAEGEEDTELAPDAGEGKKAEGEGKAGAGATQTKANSIAPPGLSMQDIISLRSSYFDLSQEDCLFADEHMLDIDSEQAVNLFPDLPLYSDFLLPSDSGSDKRIEESSAWAGRIANMTRLLESKPWLVSTIEPARYCSTDGWVSTTYTQLDDAKASLAAAADGQAVPTPPPASLLFTPRKGREQPAADVIVAPPAVPNPDERASSIFWSSEDDSLLLSLQAKHGMNWSLIAHLFNHSVARPEMDFRLAWDVYDRWNRLAGPGSREVLKDGTEIRIPLPTYVPPAQTLNNFEGSKKRLRHLAMYEAMRKVQKKREVTAAKQAPPGPPRKINMSMHDSHNMPARPFFSPMDWSAIKLEQDQAKARLRQEQQQLALQHQRQQQAAAAAAAASQAQAQAQAQAQQQQQLANSKGQAGQSASPQPNGASPAVRYAQMPPGQPSLSPQPNGARYPQPVPQGFPIQQGRVSLPLQGPPTSAAAAAAQAVGRLAPSPSTPGAVGGSPLPNGASPHIVAASLPHVGTPPLGQPQQQVRLGGPGPSSSAHSTPQLAPRPLSAAGQPPSTAGGQSLSAAPGQQTLGQQQQQQQQQGVAPAPVPPGGIPLGPGGANISPEQLQLYHQRQQQLMQLQMQRAAQAQQGSNAASNANANANANATNRGQAPSRPATASPGTANNRPLAHGPPAASGQQ